MSKVEEVEKALFEEWKRGFSSGETSKYNDWGRYARAAIEAIDADDDAFVHAVGELMHDARFSVSGETYPVVRNFIRALKAAALSEEG
ncbi:hypothetical protein [Mesorhizobium sp. A556]